MILAPKTEIHGVFALKTKDSDVAVNKTQKEMQTDLKAILTILPFPSIIIINLIKCL